MQEWGRGEGFDFPLQFLLIKNYQEKKKPGRGKHICYWLDLRIDHEKLAIFF